VRPKGWGCRGGPWSSGFYFLSW